MFLCIPFVLKVECFTPLRCSVFCVRKQRAGSGLGLGLLSLKTLTFKHSLLSFHVSVGPYLHFLLSVLVSFSLGLFASPLHFSTLPSVSLWWMCLFLSLHRKVHSKSFSAFCFWCWHVSRNSSGQVCVCACVQSSYEAVHCFAFVLQCTGLEMKQWLWAVSADF